MAACTQIPIFPHQSPRTGTPRKLVSGQNKLGRVKTSPEKSLTRIEYRQNGKTTTKSRAFPGRFHQGNTSLGGCLSTRAVQSSRNTRRGRAGLGAPPAPGTWEYLAYGDGLNAIGPAFVAEPARFRKWRTPAAGRGGRAQLFPRQGSIDVRTQPSGGPIHPGRRS